MKSVPHSLYSLSTHLILKPDASRAGQEGGEKGVKLSLRHTADDLLRHRKRGNDLRKIQRKGG